MRHVCQSGRVASLHAVSIAAFAAMTSPAAAQQSLPTIDIGRATAARKFHNSGVERFETPAVTTKRTPEKAVQALAATSVVNRSYMERFQTTTISDVLREVPSVTVQEQANDPGQAVNIRGLQDFGRVNVLVDGARQNFQTSGHSANGTFFLEPEFLAQADVTRGPTSNIYGSGAIGGVVSFRTRDVDDILKPEERYGATQKVQLSSNRWGFMSNSALAARLGGMGGVFGQFVYRNRTAYYDGAGKIVPDTGNEVIGGLAKATFTPLEGHRVTASALVQHFDYANSGTDNQSTRFATGLDARTFTLGYRFARPEYPLIDFSAKGYYTETLQDQTLLAPTQTTYATGGRVDGQRSNHIGTWGFDVNNTSRFMLLTFDHAVTIGGDGAFDQVVTQEYATGGSLTALTPSGRRDLSGAFIQDELRYGGWLRVLGALRYDQYSLQGGAYSSGGQRLNPKITVGLSPLEGVEVYGGYAEGYRAPSVTETLISGTHPFPAFNILPNPTLRPEIARNVEGGVNVSFNDIVTPGDKLRGKFGGFVNQVENYIDIEETGAAHLVPFIPGYPVSTCATRPFLCFGIRDYQYQNVAKAQISGIEGEGAYDWGGGFFSVSGFINDGRNLTTNAPLATVAPSRISGTLAFRGLQNNALTAGIRYTAVGGRNCDYYAYADANNQCQTLISSLPVNIAYAGKPYDLVDLFANYDWNDRIFTNVLISNATNRNYTQYRNAAPSPGLTIRFSLGGKFAVN
ncbi:TonB-dependent hemoglobin/transferrin/lactoferrin family receptor [Methylocystis parvus]|uniref:TonB-dependent hemoglobin/transferrin/lactoferrin family receptor n=1 Tax=Methylocystis parvus TaxID=134 RepID=A0A6B8LWH4_9HYPH|nr:TonB-dependent hemoglobin/transferrin/lactoferrin family receptor [Methylocystis parvus]QGM96717.1 TonB-dependent hemoglobin/transferrin/lactoferrin family receptor [Methylocystis parvus]WBJ99416.1 TonB-dependent hemoglobin/transferrin/lactoferrin family receptor [Methylocystis parvus OBBP]